MTELGRIAKLTGLAAMAAAAFAGSAASPRAAAPADVFTIAGVAVDATADTAVAARGLALAAGHRAAYRRLVARLVPLAQQEAAREIGAGELAALVRDFEIEDEKTSPVRYLATLRFRFDRRGVRNRFRAAKIGFAETPSKPRLVLPVYRVAGADLLWDEPNPWRDSWNALPASDGLVPLVLPAGGLADINDVSATQAVDGQEDRLQAITGRYGAAGVIVIRAQRGRDGGAPALRVITTRFGADEGAGAQTQRFAAAGRDESALLAAAAAATMRRIEEDWKARNLLRFDRRASVVAKAPLAGLADWAALDRKLSRVALLWASELVALTRRQATVRLGYFGDARQLQTALGQNDIVLSRTGSGWALRLAGNGSR